MEQRVGGHDQQNRSLLEQLMKFQQDVKVIAESKYTLSHFPNSLASLQMDMKKMEHALLEEKNQRMRMSTALQNMTLKMNEMDDRVRVAETNARENKNALTQLIMHTKNVERAVNTSQQEIVAKKEMQAQK